MRVPIRPPNIPIARSNTIGLVTPNRFLLAFALVTLLALGAGCAAHGGLSPIRVADDNRGFVFAAGDQAGTSFRIWGVNYDHNRDGKLIEDYWHEQWPVVVEDFKEMKQLGANVVRVHLQFGKFMDGPDKPNAKSLAQLAKLVTLADDTGLYLDITGHACYHKAETPAWYVSMKEKDRWAAQAHFWEAIARTCTAAPGSAAVFCYDLMNEPISPGGKAKADDWLPGNALGGKHFVQRITLEPDGRKAEDIAVAWIQQLSAAIRKHDQRALITVGLLPWSLPDDRRKFFAGLYSGFDPKAVAPHVDFIATHIYPESKKHDQAMDTLRGFAVGKPIVVEEFFALKCSFEEADAFVKQSKEVTGMSGFVSFYWGKTEKELKEGKTLQDAILAKWLEYFSAQAGGRSRVTP